MLNNRMSSRGAPGGPFKGFAAFQETDARSFFGRDETIRRIVARFARATQPPERLVVLIGSSASGKTSLVRAGLIPALRQGALPGSEVWTLDERDISALPQIADLLARMANSSPTPGYFLFIDRFEQVRAHSRAAQIRFCDSTYAALQSGTVRLLLAVSAYAYDDILKILPRDFCDMIRKRTEALLPPQAHDRTEIITGQASVASVTVEASLLPLIVAESGDQPGSLPWLQTTLSRLYEVCDEGLLTLAAYRSFSGLGGLLARQAGEIYGSLDEAGKAAARQLFLRLVDADQQPAARRAPLSDILGLEGEAGRLDDIREVMGRFLSGRLLALDRDPQTAQPTVGLAHDLLIRHWEPLLEWYASVKDDLPYVRRWSADAVEWEQAGRTPDFLATGVRLDQYVFCQQQTDLAFTQRERAFLAESVHERDLRKQQVRDRKEYVSGLEVRSRGATWLLFTVVFLVLALLGGAITLLITRRVGTPVVILPTDTALPATPALVATLPPTLTETPTRAPSQTPTPRPTRTPTHPPSAVPSATPVEISAAPDPESLRLAAEANAILRDKGGSPELAALLAVQSLKISYTTQGDNALAEALVRDYTRRIWAQSAPISQIAYTPDGASLVVASDKVRVLQASTGSVTRCCSGCCAISSARTMTRKPSGCGSTMRAVPT